MRPRFSLRRLLLFTALVAAACYWWIARPTNTAKRFVAAVNCGDFAAAQTLFGPGPMFHEKWANYMGREIRLESYLAPRSWHDLVHGRRRIDLQYAAGSSVVLPNIPLYRGFELQPITPAPCASLVASPHEVSLDVKAPNSFPQWYFLSGDGQLMKSLVDTNN
jgi:hypothetical protein